MDKINQQIYDYLSEIFTEEHADRIPVIGIDYIREDLLQNYEFDDINEIPRQDLASAVGDYIVSYMEWR